MTRRTPEPQVYALKREILGEYETLSQAGAIDVFYGDESGVSMLPPVPYAWQFRGEVVTLPSERSKRLNCFALISRRNRCFARTTQEKVTGDWVAQQIDAFCQTLERPTVIVLDNASVHTKAVKERLPAWEERGLFVFFLPAYSPHLNLAEILWRKLKYEWLQVGDYADKETLYAATERLLGEVGKSRHIAFSPFKKKDEARA